MPAKEPAEAPEVAEEAVEEEAAETAEADAAVAAEEAKADDTGDVEMAAEGSGHSSVAQEPPKPKEPEKPKELEEDAAADARTKVAADKVALDFTESTLNCLPVGDGKLLMTLSEGGCQFLLASVRATAGIKSGRYMFEARIVEMLEPKEVNAKAPVPGARQVVRIGFALAGSSIFLADGADSVCFDSEGLYIHDKNRKRLQQKFGRGHTVAVLLNLDQASPNANTVSLFRNGKRISEPQKLPEHLVGKALYPTVTYKNVSLSVNLGPVARHKLPFACRMVGDAAEADVELRLPKVGRPELVVPVGLPEQGFFDWVDNFIEKNPSYAEISNRHIIDWAVKSGVWKPKASGGGSLDKPDGKFEVPQLDDGSAKKVLMAVATTLRRNLIIPELKSNLIAKERAILLTDFSAADFKRKATVIMGEPNAEYKQKVHSLLLAAKQAKADADKKRSEMERERKRLLEEKKKAAEQAKKAKELAQKKKEGKAEEAADAETAEEKEQVTDGSAEAKMDVDEPTQPVELTEEEAKLWYRKLSTVDINERLLSKAYTDFSLPSCEDGFDDVAFEWQPANECSQLLQSWILNRKLTQRVEDLQPGAWFKEEWSKWTKHQQDWRRKHADYKDPAKKKAMLAKRKEDAKKSYEAAKKAAEEAGSEPPAAPEEDMEINVEDLDVFAVEDVNDIGNGEPLYANFTYEDWSLLATRYELHLLLHSFKTDLNDSDRPSFSEEHLAFYFNKYFKKTFNLKNFGVETFSAFLELVRDSVSVDDKGFLKAELAEDTSPIVLLKNVEDYRRERQRRIDAGDETAKLKFTRPTPPPPRGGAPPASAGRAGAGSQASSARTVTSRPPPPTGGRPPRAGAPASSYSRGGSAPPPPRPASGGGYKGATTERPQSSYGGAKRPYSPSSTGYGGSAPKQPRTSSYGSSSYGASSYGSSSGNSGGRGYSSSYRGGSSGGYR